MKTTLLDVVLLIDVEALCWQRGEEPPGFQSEIIEIGLALYDVKSGQVTAGGSVPIRPRGEVSPFCTGLTGWTARDLEYAETLEDALPHLKANFYSDRRVWASFGDWDRLQFERECLEKGIEYPFGSRHVNVKTLLALSEGWGEELGMAQAYKRLGKEMIGRHHSGADDAYNIARLLKYVLGGGEW